MAKATLGEYIRSLRNKRDIGVRELGRAVDVSGVHISSIEKDKNTPSPELLRKIALVLKVDVDKLLSKANQVDPEVINVIKDMDEDQASGIKGLPQRLGSKVSGVTAVALIAAAVVVVLLTFTSLPVAAP